MLCPVGASLLNKVITVHCLWSTININNTPWHTFRQLKSCRLHSLAVPSAEDVASTWSTGEKQTAQTPRRWPRNTPNKPKFPSPASDQSLAVRSWEPEASNLSLGDTATLFKSWRNTKRVRRGNVELENKNERWVKIVWLVKLSLLLLVILLPP